MGMAWKNLTSRKFSSTKVIISMVVMIIILCIFTTYSIALAEESTTIINSYRAGHYYLISDDEQMNATTYNNLRKIENIEKIDNYVVYNASDVGGYVINMDGVDYNYFYTDAFNKYKYGKMAFYNNYSFISNNEVQEFKYRWKLNGNILKEGSSVLADNSIVISDRLINELNIPKNCLGKQVTISSQDGNMVYEGKISGIIDSRYYDLTDHEKNPHLIMSAYNERVPTFIETNKRILDYETKVFIKNYLVSQQVAHDIITKAGIINFTSGSEYGLAMATTSTIVANVLTGAMSTIGFAIIVALIINILISMRFIIIKKSNYYGIINAYGAKKKKILEIMFCEMLIISLISIVAAYILTYVITLSLDAILSSLINFGVMFSWYNFLITLAVALIFTGSLAIIITAVNYSALSKKSTVKLLKYGYDR